jgi:hypothetical protein
VSPDATAAAPEAEHAHQRPLLSVVAGSPTPEELAVVVAVLSVRGGAAEEQPSFSLWARKSRNVRPSLRPGFGAWRGSYMPR